MMVRSGSGIRFDSDRPGPDFLGSDASVIDSRGAGHSRRLRSVLIQRITRNDPDPIAHPIRMFSFVLLAGHGVLLTSLCVADLSLRIQILQMTALVACGRIDDA